jgi:3D (Asp-Asp-Asp) domain-containing protein
MRVEQINKSRTGLCIHHVIFLAIALVAAAGIVFAISYQAFAGQLEDSSSSAQESELVIDSTLDQLEVVEEIDLGDQGVFLDGHVLATIHADGQVYTVDTDGKSEEELAELYGFTLENQDYTEQSENAYGYDLYVNRMTVETVTEEVEIPYETTRVADKTMKKGEEKVTTEGVNGVQVDTYEVRTLNGETTTTLMDSQVVTQAVDEVITYGTSTATATGFKNNGSSLNLTSDTIVSVDTANKTFTTSSGKVYSYSRSLTCTGYAYCEPGGLTATGTAARQGAIAVDPSVIPLGSKLFIIASDGSVVYGEATAEDTGGNIKGNTVDLFYNTESMCYSFGRRNVTIYILN